MASSAASAQTYPARPITLLVPFAAGGPTDTVARMTAQSMSKLLGQTIIVENATGAGGTIATARAARAEPDGYTLLVHHIGISTAATLYRKLPYDTKTAFAPIGLVTNAPMTIIARPDLPPNNLAELITYIKANGDKMTFGNAGLGAASHLCGMLFMTAIDKQVLTVPYKGNAPRDERPDRKTDRPHLRPDHQHHRPDRLQAREELRHHHQIPPRLHARPAHRRRSRPEGL
jgi:tripartite-type tricarboxylate transporter receptor subunit TctC